MCSHPHNHVTETLPDLLPHNRIFKACLFYNSKVLAYKAYIVTPKMFK